MKIYRNSINFHATLMNLQPHPYTMTLLASICVILLAYTSFQPRADTCDQSQGATTRHEYRSQLIQTTMYYTIYLPPCYNTITTDTYPHLYLLHGSVQYDDHWLRLGIEEILNEGIYHGNYPPMIVILPYGNWIANENQFDQVSFEQVFLDELIPTIETNYRVDPSQRAIGGISRGGFWAFLLAFRHPNHFESVGGHSAFFDPYHTPESHNPLDLALDETRDLQPLRIWLDRGINDYASPGLDTMNDHLRTRALPFTYQIYNEGEHNDTYWQQHVADYLQFYTQTWLNPPDTPLLPDPDTFKFTPTNGDDSQWELYLPVVAFNSTQSTLSTAELQTILNGEVHQHLYLDNITSDRLRMHKITLNPTDLVMPEALLSTLWQDRDAFAILPFDQITPRLRVLRLDDTLPLLNDLDDYPLAFKSDTPNFNSQHLTTLTLSGVTALTRRSIPAIDDNGLDWVTSGIAPYTTQVDFFHTSNEVSFTQDCPKSIPEQLGAFCSKWTHFPILVMIGLDIVELSGNHNNDFGYPAYTNTLELYRQAGIQTVGGGETTQMAQQPLILWHQGNSIAMLACNDVGPYYALVGDTRPGAASCTGAWLKDTLKQLKSETNFIIVTVQHLEFEEYQPRQTIIQDFRQIANWGADVVVGTHAHKPQTFEFYGDAWLHYGLGNLFFDQTYWGNRRFWMDTLYIYKQQLHTVDLFTGIIDDQARPRPMTADERKTFLEFMFIVNHGVIR